MEYEKHKEPECSRGYHIDPSSSWTIRQGQEFRKTAAIKDGRLGVLRGMRMSMWMCIGGYGYKW